MAKKRGAISPLGNTVGSEEAQKAAAQAGLASLTKQLSTELEKAGQDVTQYLQDQFGLSGVGSVHEWLLPSGQKALFNEVTLSLNDVKNKTTVSFEVNGRDQDFLTPESLQDLASLEFQQFYPAVGREIAGKIDVLDGSRRRAWFLLNAKPDAQFKILVSKDDISVEDAKALAKQLQTAKEHNLREIGKRCLALMEANESITQSELAQQLNISQSKVSRALKAASVDERLVQLFRDINTLSSPDYQLLSSVSQKCEDVSQLSDFIEIIKKELVNIQSEYSVNDEKEHIISLIKSELSVLKPKTDKAVVTSLKEFDAKGQYARKKVNGRYFSYEFGRLSADVQKKLDAAIEKVLREIE